MCGIAGLQWNADRDARAIVERMTQAIRHRGPDSCGIHVEDGIALGHARLEIIDLAGGSQPMSISEGRLWVTFNGEIFNYVELREHLQDRGHTLHSHSDTETILHLYEEYGDDCVHHMNGDFAFGLWDASRKRLLLARDRMGVRPLFYARVPDGLAFASEIKALFTHPSLHAKLDPIALDQCFHFWFPIAPRTGFVGIDELPPGHLLVSDANGIHIRQYWELDFPDATEEVLTDEAAVADEVAALLLDSTKIRLRADVPVGAYLSGGLDSAATAAMATRIKPGDVRTFSIGFESPEFDETAQQQQVAALLGTRHVSTLSRVSDIARDFPAVIRHVERPILRTAPTPMYRLAALVREHGYKVVLTGEGADEAFAGYDIFKEAKVRRFWSKFPESRLRPKLLRRLYPYLPGVTRQPPAFLEAFFRPGIENPCDPFFSHRPRWSLTARIRDFYSRDLVDALGTYDPLEELAANLPARYANWHPLSQAQYLESAYLLPGYLLSSQADRVSMAHAVEGRYPFLDHRVVEYATRISPSLKLHGLREKHILRVSMARFVPGDAIGRVKQPYRAPDGASFFGPNAPDYVADLLSPEAIAKTGLFDPAKVSGLTAKFRRSPVTGARENMALTGILSVQLLHQEMIGSI